MITDPIRPPAPTPSQSKKANATSICGKQVSSPYANKVLPHRFPTADPHCSCTPACISTHFPLDPALSLSLPLSTLPFL